MGGMGLCEKREVPITQQISGWASQTAMHMLCERCAKLAAKAA